MGRNVHRETVRRETIDKERERKLSTRNRTQEGQSARESGNEREKKNDERTGPSHDRLDYFSRFRERATVVRRETVDNNRI